MDRIFEPRLFEQRLFEQRLIEQRLIEQIKIAIVEIMKTVTWTRKRTMVCASGAPTCPLGRTASEQRIVISIDTVMSVIYIIIITLFFNEVKHLFNKF